MTVDPIETTDYAAFISYASPDHEKAEEIRASLEEKGHRCWIAPRDVRAGHEYGAEIIRGIERSRCMVLLLSDSANQSPHVRNEVERGVSKRKPVFPVRLEDVMPSPGLELFVSASHWIDAWTGRMVDHIAKLARDMSDDEIVKHATAESVKAKRRRQMPRWIATAAGFVALVVAIVVGNYIAGQFREKAQSASPALVPPQVSTPEHRQQLQEDAAATVFKQMAGDPAKLTKEDFRVDVSLPNKLTLVLSIKPKDEIVAALGMAKLEYAIGDGAFVPVSRSPIQLRREDKLRLEQAGKIRVQYTLRYGPKIGPFEYDVVTQGLAGNQTLAALAELPQWVEARDDRTLNFRFFSGMMLAEIARIRLGETADALDWVLENTALAKRTTGGRSNLEHLATFSSGGSGVMRPPGVNTLYCQIELLDGRRTEVRKHDLTPDTRPSGRLEFTDGPKDLTPPKVFVIVTQEDTVSTLSRAGFEIVPIPPPGSASLLLSVGDATPKEMAWLQPFVPENWDFDKPLRLIFRKADGSEVGPFSYRIKDPATLFLATVKARLVEDRRNIAECKRVSFQWPMGERPPMTEPADVINAFDKEKFDREMRIRNAPNGEGPGVNCYLTQKARTSMAFCAVKEVRFGTEPGKLDKRVIVGLDYAERLNHSIRDDYNDQHTAWRVLLPVDAKQIYTQLVFIDGSTAPETAIGITDVDDYEPGGGKRPSRSGMK